MRAHHLADPPLSTLTGTLIPATGRQLLDRVRHADLARSLAEHPTPTPQAAEAAPGTRDALRESRGVSGSPRTIGLKVPTPSLHGVRVACPYMKARPALARVVALGPARDGGHSPWPPWPRDS